MSIEKEMVRIACKALDDKKAKDIKIIAVSYTHLEIKVVKQTKRSEKEIDLRPNIYKMEVRENGFFYMLASASSNYTKPEMVTNTFFHWIGEELPEFAFTVKPVSYTHLDVYKRQSFHMFWC